MDIKSTEALVTVLKTVRTIATWAFFTAVALIGALILYWACTNGYNRYTAAALEWDRHEYHEWLEARENGKAAWIITCAQARPLEACQEDASKISETVPNAPF